MAMLRSCSFPDCETFTLLSPYCVEHEQLIATLDAEPAPAGDEPMVRELAEVAQPAVTAAAL
jgi:hypothetical protein